MPPPTPELRTPGRGLGGEEWAHSLRGERGRFSPHARPNAATHPSPTMLHQPLIAATERSENGCTRPVEKLERERKQYESKVLCSIVARQQEELQRLKARVASYDAPYSKSFEAPSGVEYVEPQSQLQSMRYTTRTLAPGASLGRRQLNFAEFPQATDASLPTPAHSFREGLVSRTAAAESADWYSVVDELRAALRVAIEGRQAAEERARQESEAREAAEHKLVEAKATISLAQVNATAEASHRERECEERLAIERSEMRASLRAEKLSSQRRERAAIERAASLAKEGMEVELASRAEALGSMEGVVKREREASCRAAELAAQELAAANQSREEAEARCADLLEVKEKQATVVERLESEAGQLRRSLHAAESRATKEADARARERAGAEAAAEALGKQLADARAKQAAAEEEARWLAEAKQAEVEARDALEAKLRGALSEASAAMKHGETLRLQQSKQSELQANLQREVAASELREAVEQLQKQQETIDVMLKREVEYEQETASLRMTIAQHGSHLRERDAQMREVRRQAKAAMEAYRCAVEELKHRLSRFEESAQHTLLRQRMQGLEKLLRAM